MKADYEECYNDACQDPWRRFSAAVGLAEKTKNDSTVEPVFKRADEAMYEDKEKFKEKYGSAR